MQRAAIFIGYRFFTDSWGIKADTIEVGYTHPVEENWMFETSVRYYNQNQADFYSDLFPFEDAQNYLARDKELSNFTDYSFNIGVSYILNTDKVCHYLKKPQLIFISAILYSTTITSEIFVKLALLPEVNPNTAFLRM